MKKLALAALALAALAGPAFAQHKIGENVTATITGKAAVTYDDNVLLAQTGPLSDTAFEFAPGIDVLFGAEGASTTATLVFSESIKRYVDTSALNTNLATINLTGQHNVGRLTSSLDAGYSQSDQNTPVSGVPGRLRRNTTTFGTDGKYVVIPEGRSTLGLGFKYENTDYKQTGLADSTIYTVPVTFNFPWTEKLFVSPGIRYRETQLKAPGTDFTDYYYSIGLNGEFDAQLSGNLSVGLNHRTPKVGKSESTLGLDASLTYKHDVTTYNLTLNNDFGQASIGTSQKNSKVGVGVSRPLADRLSASANVNYNLTDYAGTRKDKYWDATVSVTYTVDTHIGVSASYGYKNNGSNALNSSYNDNVFSLSVNVRY